MASNKEGNWFKNNSYLATWIGFILYIGTLIGASILVINIVGSPCIVEYYSDLTVFVAEECEEMNVGEEKYISQEILNDFVKLQDNSGVEGILKKGSKGCTISFRCIYQEGIVQKIKIADSVKVTVKRNGSNETVQIFP